MSTLEAEIAEIIERRFGCHGETAARAAREIVESGAELQRLREENAALKSASFSAPIGATQMSDRTEYEKLREKVARAILKAEFYDIEPEMYASLEAFYEEVWPDHGDEALEQAEAAMSTIYEGLKRPTAAMWAAGASEMRLRHGYADAVFSAYLAASPLNGGRDE